MVITNWEGTLRKETNDTILILCSFQKQNVQTYANFKEKKIKVPQRNIDVKL